jgi:hypothetical protein
VWTCLSALELQQLQQGYQNMSASLLYHGWGLRGYRYLRSAFTDGRIEFVVEQKPETLRCSSAVADGSSGRARLQISSSCGGQEPSR